MGISQLIQLFLSHSLKSVSLFSMDHKYLQMTNKRPESNTGESVLFLQDTVFLLLLYICVRKLHFDKN